MDIALEVLKWALVILIAGFIGQFGKSLSLQVIDYYRKRKERTTSPPPVMTMGAGKAVSSPSADKKGKQEEGIPLVREDGETPAKEVTTEAKEQNAKAVKKALKAQLKARKKTENN